MRTLYVSLIAVALLASVGQVAVAQSPWQPDRTRCVRKGSFEVSKWEIAELRLEHSSLSDVEKIVGLAKRVRIGSDAVSAKALCYSLGEDQVVVFESGPLGGPRELLTAVSVLKRAEASFAAECAQPTRDLKKDVSCDRAVGAARADVEKIAGAEHCYRDGAATEWNFEQEHDDWTTLSGLHASFDQDKLRWWRVYSVTSR
ncbi:MAG: hypothetical protein ACOY42_01190 [Pseudomonadota bacterium]|jgi:hypothetical protein